MNCAEDSATAMTGFEKEEVYRSCVDRTGNIRVLINERGDIVDLVVNDHVKILLCGVGRNFGESKCLVGHYTGCEVENVREREF